MKITKDEARILSEALAMSKFDLPDNLNHDLRKDALDALEDLETRLYIAGEDTRRKGRTSQNSFTDCFKRFIKKYLIKQELIRIHG